MGELKERTYQGRPAGLRPLARERNYRKCLLAEFRRLRRKRQLVGAIPEGMPKIFDKRRLNRSDKKTAIRLLAESPELQARLAGTTGYTPGKWLLEQELSLRKPRERNGERSWPGLRRIVAGGVLHFAPASRDRASDLYQDVYDAAADERLSGVAFSGGGIRSATFCLGILQAMAARGKLRNVDYLSSVSGGGYIHQWLASWIWNQKASDSGLGGLAGVTQQLIPLPDPRAKGREAPQISWLRQYSSYLTPQRGIFSADTWTMICTWLRNTTLNQIVLFTFLGTCMLAVRASTYPFLGAHAMHTLAPHRYWLDKFHDQTADHPALHWLIALMRASAAHLSAWFHSTAVRYALWWGLVAWLLCSAFCLGAALRSQNQSAVRDDDNTSIPRLPLFALGNKAVCAAVAAPGAIAAFLLALNASGKPPTGFWPAASTLYVGWWLYLFLLQAAIIVGSRIEAAESPVNVRATGAARYPGCLVGAVLVASLSVGLASYVSPRALYGVGAQRHQMIGHSEKLQHASVLVAGLVNAGFAAPEILNLNQAITASDGTSSKVSVVYRKAPATQPSRPFLPREPLAIFGPAVFFFFQFMSFRLQIGWIGRLMPEQRREWMARLGAWCGIAGLLWITVALLAHLGPVICAWFLTKSALSRVIATLGVLAVHGVTLYAGGSSKTSGKPDPTSYFGYKPLDLVGIVGAPISIMLLMILISGLLDKVLRAGAFVAVLVSLAMIVTFLFFGWRVDVNDFSMHGFYRNRLARCYLGATNPNRMPDPFTGFDEHTEANLRTGMPLSALWPTRFGGDGAYDGPLPIFCSTLNLTFGEDLAYQERKAASFAFTPIYSGYHVPWTQQRPLSAILEQRRGMQKMRIQASRQIAPPPGRSFLLRSHLWLLQRASNLLGSRISKNVNTTFSGFVPTGDYAYPNGGPQLASVTAICGAALSPNQGYNSQPALAFLMTLFNVRLGWWIVNPRKRKLWQSKQRKGSPSFGLGYLIKEMLGRADDTSNYVCLSDGGNFDNMGLYELVRRRCSRILICDAECDAKTTFEGIGMSIVKCRTDFGVEIVLPLAKLQPDAANGLSPVHFVEGTIRYPAPPGGPTPGVNYTGKIVYIKTAVVGDEPGDILHYKRDHPAFPQETTLNQWFTESQFESYRRLGQLSFERAYAASATLQTL